MLSSSSAATRKARRHATLQNDTCCFLAGSFDTPGWREDATAFL